MTYSHSSLNAFKDCPRRFAFQYLEKPSVEKRESIEAYLGTICHAAVQQIYKDLLLSRRMTLEETLAFYEAEWDRERPERFWIVKERYNEDNYRETGRRFVKDFYEEEAPFEDGRTIGIEKKLQIDLGCGKGLVGYVDRLVDHGEGRFEIIDYKTGADLPGLAELEKNWQLPLYHLGIKQMLPEAGEVTCTWHYLAHRKKLSLRRSSAQLDELVREVTALIGQIESTSQFDPKPNSLCSWCDYEPICPARKHLFTVAALPAEKFSKDEGVRLVDAYMEAKRKKEAAEGEVKTLEEKIFLYAEQYRMSAVRGTRDKLKVWIKEGAAKLVSREEDPLAAAAVAAVLKHHGLWDRFSNLASFALMKAIDEGELPPAVLEELRPFLRREKVRRLYPSKV